MKRELASVVIFESHAKAGTVCESPSVHFQWFFHRLKVFLTLAIILFSLDIVYIADILKWILKKAHINLHTPTKSCKTCFFLYIYFRHMWGLMCTCHLCFFFFSVFNQGEEGTSWYIIQKGSVNVVIYGKVCVSAGMRAQQSGKFNQWKNRWKCASAWNYPPLEAAVMSKSDLLPMTHKCD